uniref:Uncharacterized protein n=1 Tax=Lepeophtheirus salmonis TaxID=72036 RepID=A0A0K2U9K7_LEPSM
MMIVSLQHSYKMNLISKMCFLLILLLKVLSSGWLTS